MNPLSIGQGSVFHSRRGEIQNSFRYPVYFLFFHTEAAPDLRKLFTRGLWRVFSLKSKDYLLGKSGDLDELVKEFLKERCDYEAEEVWLQTMPRMFGYVFNPVSFWICHKAKKVDAVLVEVNNTFGERHFYWLPQPVALASQEWMESPKQFHVSPFMPVDGSYKFRFHLEKNSTKIDIFHHSPSGKLRLATWVQGDLSALSSQSPLRLLMRYGWMTPLIVLRIHAQAFRLWIKKARFYTKPALPRQEVTK